MKLAKLANRVPIKITVSVTAELNQALGEYAAVYEATYGSAEPVSALMRTTGDISWTVGRSRGLGIA